MLRDQRVRWFAIVLVLASLVALAGGVARHERLSAERDAAVRADAEAWVGLGSMDPHSAAHFGHYAFRPISVLSSFDPGLLDHLGVMVRLEAHKQHPASGLPADGGKALTSFASFTAASALQVFAPILLILIGFTAFSGETARQLLRQELAAGVSPRTLLLGRLVALGTVVGAMLAVFGAAAATMLLFSRASGEEFLRLGLSLFGYATYLFAVLALSLGVSALCRSSRTALAVLLGAWVCAVLLVPRVAPAVAAWRHPLPSIPEFQSEVGSAAAQRRYGGQSAQTGWAYIQNLAMEKYGVDKIEDLPVNVYGFSGVYHEEISTEEFRRHFAEVHRTYALQEGVQRVFAALSPLVALKAWSAALAGSDFASHEVFLQAAEEYRYDYVQALNRNTLEHGPSRERQADHYETDIASITAHLGHFEPPALPLSAVLRNAAANLLILLAWLAAAGGFAFWSARRLPHTV